MHSIASNRSHAAYIVLRRNQLSSGHLTLEATIYNANSRFIPFLSLDMMPLCVSAENGVSWLTFGLWTSRKSAACFQTNLRCISRMSTKLNQKSLGSFFRDKERGTKYRFVQNNRTFVCKFTDIYGFQSLHLFYKHCKRWKD